MDPVFTQATVVLSAEYVELFTSEQLASRLSKVSSLTGVKCSKANNTYALTGSWEQVNDAFLLLEKWLDITGQNELSTAENVGNTDEKSTKPSSEQSQNEIKRTADQVEQTLDPINDHADETDMLTESNPLIWNEKNTLLQNNKKNGKPRSIKVKKESNAEIDNINICTDKHPKISKENKQNIKTPIKKSLKTLTKKGKKKVLSELTYPHQQKDKTCGQNGDVSRYYNSVTTYNTELSHDLTESNKDEIKDSFKENENSKSNSSNECQSKVNDDDDDDKNEKRMTRKPGDVGYWSRVKIPDYNEKHKCTKCDVVLKSRKRYMEHLRRIHIKEFKCDVCLRRFGYPTDLHRHKCPGVPDPNKEQKSKGGRPKKLKPKVTIFLPCPECEYIGTSKKRFNGHVRRAHRLIFPCNECGRKFGFSRDLQRHKDNVHAETSYFCDKCSKFYKSKNVFDIHIKTHEEGYVKPTFECQVCAKSFTTKYVLASHIKTEHLGIKKVYLCQICGKSFSQRNSYKQHSNAHAGIKPYKCEVCGKAFTYHKSLKEHKFMHDNIRRFQCQLCEKAFRQRTTLQIHMKVHKTIKDHLCKTCGKGFAQKQALERHERIHTGVKPYTCVPCQRTFGDASTIRRHMLAIHQKDENNWREDIICTVKKKTDYYVLGGSGQNRTYRTKKSSVQSSSSKSTHKEDKKAVIQSTPISEASFILINTHEQCSSDYKNEYSLSNLAALQEQTGQLQGIQPSAIYAVSTSIPHSQHAQTPVNPQTGGAQTGSYRTSGSHVLDFSTLSQTGSQPHSLNNNLRLGHSLTHTISQPQVNAEKEPEPCADQAQLAQPTFSSNTLQNSTLNPVTESQRQAQVNGLQTTTSDAAAFNQTLGNIWGFAGYQAYYNAATQYQTTQNQ